MWQSLPRFQNIGANSIMAGQNPAILILAASIRPGQSWDLRLPYASLRVTLRVGTQKQPTFMHLLTGLRLQHPPRGSEASKRELPGSESQNENCCCLVHAFPGCVLRRARPLCGYGRDPATRFEVSHRVRIPD